MTGFQRVADSVAIDKAFRTSVRPPATVRLPRICPELRLTGATPTSAAIRRRSSWPSSGKSAIRVREGTSPTPGTDVRRSSAARQIGEPRTELLMSRSSSASWASRVFNVALIVRWTRGLRACRNLNGQSRCQSSFARQSQAMILRIPVCTDVSDLIEKLDWLRCNDELRVKSENTDGPCDTFASPS